MTLSEEDLDYLSRFLHLDRNRLEILAYVISKGGKASVDDLCKRFGVPKSTLYNKINISPNGLRKRGLARIHRSQVYADQIGLEMAVQKLAELRMKS